MFKLVVYAVGTYALLKLFGGGSAVAKKITGMSALARIPLYLGHFKAAADKHGMDLVTLLAIGWKESNFNPDAISPDGHDKGLMQINDRAHASWHATHNWRDPAQNIDYGAQVLAEAYRYWRNKGLTGSMLDRAAIASYNTGAGNVSKSLAAGKDPDATTANKNYGTDVIGRRATIDALV